MYLSRCDRSHPPPIFQLVEWEHPPSFPNSGQNSLRKRSHQNSQEPANLPVSGAPSTERYLLYFWYFLTFCSFPFLPLLLFFFLLIFFGCLPLDFLTFLPFSNIYLFHISLFHIYFFTFTFITLSFPHTPCFFSTLYVFLTFFYLLILFADLSDTLVYLFM